MRRVLYATLAILAAYLMLVGLDAQQSAPPKHIEDDGMSPMGALAKRVRQAIQKRIASGAPSASFEISLAELLKEPPEECDDCSFDPDFNFPGGGFNSEIHVAVDPTGTNIVIGFNDARGFAFTPTSLSGVAYSHDGGATFIDGGRLPSGPTEVVAGATVPQIFGDPDVKWVPGGAGCQFVYSSIMVKRFPATGTATGLVQTMSLHKSTDCGVTWSNPIEVTAATNPNGGTSGGSANDDADKEFIDVDPETGRVLMSWTNFSSNVEIRTTFSDNIFTGSPTWSPGVVVSTSATSGYFGQGSMPRFLDQSNNVYVVFSESSKTLGTPYSGFRANNIGFARSTDNGATWSPVVNLRTSDYYPPDYILGNDRVHSFPAMAVDNSSGPNGGNIYVVYAENAALGDGGDVMLQRSIDGGLSFSPRLILSPRPGADRPQWFPSVAVDRTTGRVSVYYHDQSVSASGDVTQLTWVYSDNGGTTWSTPSRVCAPPTGNGPTNACDRPFHAGYGNDTSQPNLGDYIGSDALLGAFHVAFAGTPKIVPYTDGQPSAALTTPEVRYKKLTVAAPALDIGTITIVDSGGNGLIDAGDLVRMLVPLTNFVTNSRTSPVTYTAVTGTLSTTTAGVTLLRSSVAYPNIEGGTRANGLEYVFQVAPGFTPGTPIDFNLAIATAQGSVSRAFYRNTGTPAATAIFSENFDAVPAGSLPAGWTPSHGGGNNTVPWTTDNTFCGTGSNALFHVNANDGTLPVSQPNPTRFERAFSPLVTVPPDAGYVTLEFDTCYDTEDAPDFNVLAYDGFTLRVTDQTAGRTLRSVLAEAFAEELTTGTLNHYPKHLPRGGAPYLEDMSVWAGGNGAAPSGFRHVAMRLPGMQGSTVQLRFEYTQDSLGTCNDARPGTGTRACGVMVDNVVVRSVTAKSDELLKVTLTPVAGTPGAYTGTVTSQAVAAAGGIVVALSGVVSSGTITLPAGVVIPAGSQTSPAFSVTVSPATAPKTGTVTATGPSNSRAAGIAIF